MTQLQRTPLRDFHAARGARLVDFAGWEMPVQYRSILEEHRAVRRAAGLFDVSHMGEFDVSGPGAAAFLNRLVTNDVARLFPGRVLYSPMCYPDGGVVDDLLVYQRAADDFFLCVNAGNLARDLEWIRTQAAGHDVTVTDRSAETALLALQGPRAVPILQGLTATDLAGIGYYHFAPGEVAGVPCVLSRTGYTGEDGFEVFGPAADAVSVLGAVLAAGAEFGIKPCGLGARDTLRMEMCYPLNGNDLSPERTPIEAGLGFFVDLEKGDFTGRSVLAEQKAGGAKQRLAAFKMIGATPPPRSHYAVWKDGAQIGETCSGGLSPSLGCGIGLAYLPAEFAKPGTTIEIDVRGRRFPAQVEKKPLWRKPVES